MEFEKLLSIPDLKCYSFFLLRKSSKRVQCSNGSVAPSHEILFHSMVGDKVAWVCKANPSPQKHRIGSPAKLAFRRLLASYIYGWYSRKLPSWAMNKFPFCHHCPFPILGKPSRTECNSGYCKLCSESAFDKPNGYWNGTRTPTFICDSYGILTISIRVKRWPYWLGLSADG